MSYLDDGFLDVISSWELYALIVVISLGTYLQQSAFAGSLSQALSAISVLEPVVAVILGMTVLEEDLRAGGLEWALIAVAAVGTALATAALARSQGEAVPQTEPQPVPAPT